MSAEDKKRKFLEEYMKTASPDEVKELNRLLKARGKTGANGIRKKGLSVDVSGLAKDMSRKINEQLGMADINIKKMARDLVVQMAVQHKPDITQAELNAIVKQMVPDGSAGDISKKIPPDIMMSMIHQFVSYSTGSMPAKEQGGLPEGWAKKYWNAFSQDIRDLIAMHLKGGIDRNNFWIAVERILRKTAQKK